MLSHLVHCTHQVLIKSGSSTAVGSGTKSNGTPMDANGGVTWACVAAVKSDA